MDSHLKDLLKDLEQLEKSVLQQAQSLEKKSIYKVENRTVTFDKDIKEKQKALRKSIYRFLIEAPLLTYMIAPIIYSMIIPAVLLDIFTSIYQLFCFPMLGIPRVKRKHYIAFDRHKLAYLNWIEKLNCEYCSYFNGVIAYVREIASRTEQYFCPIKHALHLKGLHQRHSEFVPYGQTEHLRERFEQLREKLKKTEGSHS